MKHNTTQNHRAYTKHNTGNAEPKGASLGNHKWSCCTGEGNGLCGSRCHPYQHSKLKVTCHVYNVEVHPNTVTAPSKSIQTVQRVTIVYAQNNRVQICTKSM